MKSYLTLIPVYARVHGKSSRMTRCCIALAVFLTAALFGMAERWLQGERAWQLHTYGSLQLSKGGDALRIYSVALFLALLVMAAGILMISGSLNANVLQRTEFFGMLRCLGATRGQLLRYVYLEALCWCRTAVPAGLLAASAAVCLVAALMKTADPERLAFMPVWGVSLPGTCAGAALGVLTVLLAARAPAGRASRVSPMEAVRSGGRYLGSGRLPGSRWGFGSSRLFGSGRDVGKGRGPGRRRGSRSRRASGTALAFRLRTSRFFLRHPEAALGMSHALLMKRSYVLMSGAFGLCTVLFLSFSVVLDFMGHALLPPAWTPELSAASADNTCSIPRTAAEEILRMDGVKRVYGRAFAYDVPVTASVPFPAYANLISYERNQFAWAEDSLLEGSVKDAARNTGQVLYVARKGQGEEEGKRKGEAAVPGVGDTLMLETGGGEQTVTVAGILSDNPLDRQEDAATLLVSEATFLELPGQDGYTVLDIQFDGGAKKEDVEAVKACLGEGLVLVDQFDDGRAQKRLYRSMAILAYGFLAVILGITVLHIANTIRMNAQAGKQQYGILRAEGLDGGQLGRMLAAEALAYAFGGCLAGWALGIPVHLALFVSLITAFWQEAWSFPVLPLFLITGIVLSSSLLAAAGPYRSLMRMRVVDVINRGRDE